MKLEKLGTQYGGWLTPSELLAPGAVCYCAGAGEDISFDVALAERYDCLVYIFDPTPRAIAHYEQLQTSVRSQQPMPINNHPTEVYQIRPTQLENNLHFLPYGVYNENTTLKFYRPADSSHVSHSIDNLHQTEAYFSAPCKTLATAMDELKHDRIDLLKLDIEGAEGSVLENLIETDIRPTILCIEFDEALQQGEFVRAYRHARSLVRCGYVIVAEDNWNVTFVHRAAGQRLASRWRLWSLAMRAYRKQRKTRKAA